MKAVTRIDGSEDVERIVEKLTASATSQVRQHDRSVNEAVTEAIRRFASDLFGNGFEMDAGDYYRAIRNNTERIPDEKFDSYMDTARETAGDEFDAHEAIAVAQLHFTVAQRVRSNVEDG